MRIRFITNTARFAKLAAGFRPGIAYALLLAFGLQAGAPAWAWEPSRPSGSPPLVAASAPAPAVLDLGGPSVPEFKAAFPNRPGRAVQKVDPVTFSRYVNSHSGRGRLLTGSALAAVVSASGEPTSARVVAACDSLPLEARPACRDSLQKKAGDTASSPPPSQHAPKAIREMQEREAARKDSLARTSQSGANREAPYYTATDDTLILGVRPERDDRTDHTRVDEDSDEPEDERHHNWFVNIFADVREGGGGGGGWDSDDWAAVIYVVIGVVVVGAFVIYGLQMLGEMATNQEGYPLFMEMGARLSYSGKAIEDPAGVGDLYRDAYLAGLRFAIGFNRPGIGIGLAAEGGYIDVFLRSSSDPAKTFDFKGGYLVAGPMIRFGDNDPWSFSLEFLNGTSSHESIGWISKSRMTLQAKVSEHMLVGGHLGAVFYDLHFFDGLGLREGNFNRDLSLIWGLDTGWEF
jgi:hypothetical protein